MGQVRAAAALVTPGDAAVEAEPRAELPAKRVNGCAHFGRVRGHERRGVSQRERCGGSDRGRCAICDAVGAVWGHERAGTRQRAVAFLAELYPRLHVEHGNMLRIDWRAMPRKCGENDDCEGVVEIANLHDNSSI